MSPHLRERLQQEWMYSVVPVLSTVTLTVKRRERVRTGALLNASANTEEQALTGPATSDADTWIGEAWHARAPRRVPFHVPVII